MSAKEKTLKEMVIDILKVNNSTEGMTPREIAKTIAEQYPDFINAKIKKTSVNDEFAAINQITNEIYANKNRLLRNDSNIIVKEESPKLFLYEHGTVSQYFSTTNESSLYEPFKDALLSSLNVYAMRINEKTSEKSSGKSDTSKKWLHPDLVGVQDIAEEWDANVKTTQSFGCDLIGGRFKLWSFEVKKEINGSNVREYYFQAVANSSWANFGYLVAQNLQSSKQTDVMKELELLSQSFGVGVILFSPNKETGDEIDIIIPAKEKPIQWNSVDKLTINKDFKHYIENLNKTVKIEKINENDWK